MRQSQPILLLTLIAAAAIAEFRFITAAGAVSGIGDHSAGVTQFAADAAGDAVPVAALGTSVVETGDAFAADVLLEADADGKAIPFVAGPALARSLEVSGGAGEFVEVILLPN